MEIPSLGNVYSVIVRLMLLAGLGFLFYRQKILGEETVKFLTGFLINVCVPCLIFINLTEHFLFNAEYSLSFFLLLSVAVFLVGFICAVIFVLVTKEKNLSREILILVAFQNAGYLPMNIFNFLFSSPLREKLLTYVFLTLLGYNILLWSGASFLILKKKHEKFRLKYLFTPPLIATLCALLLKKVTPGFVLPDILLSPMKMLGQMSFVLSMLVLGAGLAKAGLARITGKKVFDIISVVFLKLIIVPLIALLFVAKFKMLGLIGFFVVLQSAMPSAVSLPIIAKYRRANYEFTSQAVFFTHILSIITIPFWINVFSRLQF